MAVENTASSSDESELAFVTTRLLDAPRERVWQAFSQAEQLKHWWGPVGFALDVVKLEFQPGGHFHYRMHTPQGVQMWGRFVYRDIVAPERIVFVNSFADVKGDAVRAPWEANWPLEVLNTLTLVETDGKTLLTLRGVPLATSETELKLFKAGFDSMTAGFGGTWNQLATFLALG